MLGTVLKKKFGYTAYVWSGSSIFSREKRHIRKLEEFEGRVAKIAASDNHSALITDEGELYTWGDNGYGQLGLKADDSDKLKSVDKPTLVPYFKDNNVRVKDVVVGKHHTIALDDKGRVFSWGRGIMSNIRGTSLLFPSALALGHPKPKNLSTPKPILKLRNVPIQNVATGNHFAIALAQSGELYVWGRGEFGVLGFENKEEKEPVINPYITDIIKSQPNTRIAKIDSSSDFSSILLSNGVMLNFGNNDQGNMGLGVTQSVDMCDSIQIPLPTKFENEGDLKIVDMDLGECTTTIQVEDGRIFLAGQKLYYYPQLFEIDYKVHKVKTFCSSDRASVVITADNRLFYRGNFWSDKNIEENIDTGVVEADVQKAFGGSEIVSVGGKYGDKWALVKSN